MKMWEIRKEQVSHERIPLHQRGIDIILSGMAIVILSPLLLFLCIAIKLDTPGPILFKQKRVGIHRSFFQIYKFRTMRIDTPKDVPTHMLENPEQYITKVGKFLRKTSLDELPQILISSRRNEYRRTAAGTVESG